MGWQDELDEARREQQELLRRAEQERRDREVAAFRAELDAEIDAEQTDGEPVDGERLPERITRLEREAEEARAIREAAAKPPAVWRPGAIMRADALRRRRFAREQAAREQREDALGVPDAQQRWDACERAISGRRDA